MARRRILYCFPVINGYMASCWRALAQRPNVDLLVVAYRPAARDLVGFHVDIMEDVPSVLLNARERSNYQPVQAAALRLDPDLIIVSGWSERAYLPLYFDRLFHNVPKVMVVDNQLRYTIKQHLGWVAFRALVDRVACWWAVGERAWQLGRFMGFPERKLRRGAIGVDVQLHSRSASMRSQHAWPRRFIFTGRYHPRKGLDVLAAAYKKYRATNESPWPLALAGQGPHGPNLMDVNGVEDLGFLSPTDVSAELAKSGVFVMPSRFDAWPLAIVEAAAAGLPIIATEECGSAVEIVRHLYNGLTIPTGSPDALASALTWMQQRHCALPEMGRRSTQLALPFDAVFWADRAVEIADSFGRHVPNA